MTARTINLHRGQPIRMLKPVVRLLCCGDVRRARARSEKSIRVLSDRQLADIGLVRRDVEISGPGQVRRRTYFS
jgi:uncharacterized protein YjiS (DUF1127 family)